ncbi:MAG: KpsF/GutQ family sugar-phosphate isomerase [Lachnospiraceae bacterium]|nr:KpsF/GutQ family sugar-phosphate isomerase [Lachnospiraceae bacterium]
MDKLKEARRVFNIEIEALMKTRDVLDDTFIKILDLITDCTGKVIITGMGKPGHIAEKLAATFSSLGTPSFYLHPGEAMHGDLGMVSENDLVIAISYSGESDEIVRILPNIKLIGAVLIGLTANADSTLAHASDIVQVLPKFEEACYLGLAPTSSTTVELCYGDALAVVASGIYGFKDVDFGKFHPAGSLGKRLILKVDDLMVYNNDNNITVRRDALLEEAIIALNTNVLGLVSIVDTNGKIVGVISDGDVRRQLVKKADIYSIHVEDIMTTNPNVISSGALAVDALVLMKNKNVTALPVLKDDRVMGMVSLRDIVQAGIVYYDMKEDNEMNKFENRGGYYSNKIKLFSSATRKAVAA